MDESNRIFWKNLKDKDQTAFGVFFKGMYPKLFAMALNSLNEKELSQHMVQETFCSFWTKVDTIIPQKRYMESYIVRILKNRIIDHYRQKKNKIFQNIIDDVELDALAELPDDDYDEDMRHKLQCSIESLPEYTREIFTLSKLKGYTYKEIAEEKNISIKTVEAHISKALKHLRKFFLIIHRVFDCFYVFVSR